VFLIASPTLPLARSFISPLTNATPFVVGLSAVIIFLSVSLAFSAWSRAMIQLIFRLPIELCAESLGLQDWWHDSRVKLEQWRTNIIGKAKQQREKEKKERKDQEKKARLEQDNKGKNNRINDGKADDEMWDSERPLMAANGFALRRKSVLNGNGKMTEQANGHQV
jgi:hypothetical protein